MTRRSNGLWVYNRPDGGAQPAPPPAVFHDPTRLSSADYVIYVADPTGQVIGELTGALESVTWAIDGYGMATIVIALPAVLASGRLLRFGNRVAIEFANGLPVWGGVIDVPRETAAGSVRVQLYEAAYLLGWRLTGDNDTYLDADARPAANILVNLVGAAFRDMSFDVGAARGGPPVQTEFHYMTLKAAAEQLRSIDADLHYFFRPRQGAGRRVDFELVVYREQYRDDTRRAVLIQGYNLVEWTALEQGPIYNEVRVAPADFLNSDPPAGQAGAAGVVAGDIDSQQRYGLRQSFVVLPETTGATAGEQAGARAAGDIQAYSRPRLRVQGTCLDMSPGRFRDLGIGSGVRIEAAVPLMLSEALTIIGMEFHPATGRLSLVFDDNSGIGE